MSAARVATGRVFENAISGERIVIRRSGAETGGQLLSFDLFLPPGGHVPASHVHPSQEERFTVIAGRMRFRVGRNTTLAQPGDSVLIPAGAGHWFGNPGFEVAHARVDVRPALRMEELFAATEAIGASGRLPGTQLPRLSDLASLLLEFSNELAIPKVPAFLSRAFLVPLAWLGRHRPGGARSTSSV